MIKTFAYEIPRFVTPRNYCAEDLIADAQRIGYDPKHSATSWNRIARRHPWLNTQLFPKQLDASGNVKSVIVEESHDDGRPFRPGSSGWHIDGSDFGDTLAVLRTSTGTLFAGCLLHIDAEAYEHHGFSGNPAKPIGGLGKYGADWLEQAAGIQDVRDAELSEIVVGVEDLVTRQAPDGVIATGATVSTLHRSAERTADEPTVSAIARALYSLPHPIQQR